MIMNKANYQKMLQEKRMSDNSTYFSTNSYSPAYDNLVKEAVEFIDGLLQRAIENGSENIVVSKYISYRSDLPGLGTAILSELEHKYNYAGWKLKIEIEQHTYNSDMYYEEGGYEIYLKFRLY